mmetsp:Transcript_8608/g.17190  ORF Transcript_8608/g.17190 Transcript_8608/m.17190 type:complete len:90 (+) Transcript_8608:73-342(+)
MPCSPALLFSVLMLGLDSAFALPLVSEPQPHSRHLLVYDPSFPSLLIMIGIFFAFLLFCFYQRNHVWQVFDFDIIKKMRDSGEDVPRIR